MNKLVSYRVDYDNGDVMIFTGYDTHDIVQQALIHSITAKVYTRITSIKMIMAALSMDSRE